MSVRVHIDRLVLEGLDVRYADRGRVRAAVEQELARLVSSRGLATSLRSGLAVPSLPAPAIQAGGPPARLGAAIARAVHDSVGPSEPGPDDGPATRRRR